ncbi:hypothetical protein GC176_13500 [bacterium]|nr:hypothetical protein [bacterium]
MTQFRQILAPTDFSDRSRRTVAFAAEEAERCSGVLHLLHIVSSGMIGHLLDAAVTIPSREDLISDAHRTLLKFPEGVAEAGDPDKRGIKVVREVRQGPPDVQILDYARSHQIDLIVLATHARRGMQRLLLGSVAEAILRHSPCPLLIVPPPGNH